MTIDLTIPPINDHQLELPGIVASGRSTEPNTTEQRPAGGTVDGMETLRACPYCGSVVLLVLESCEWRIVARLWCTAAGTLVCDDTDEDCEWITETTSNHAIIGCASCGARFAEDVSLLHSRTVDVERALQLLSEAAEAQRRIQPPDRPIDAAGHVHPETSDCDRDAVTCTHCGSTGWVLLVDDRSLYASIYQPDDDFHFEQEMIAGAIASWQLLGCASCGSISP